MERFRSESRVSDVERRMFRRKTGDGKRLAQGGPSGFERDSEFLGASPQDSFPEDQSNGSVETL